MFKINECLVPVNASLGKPRAMPTVVAPAAPKLVLGLIPGEIARMLESEFRASGWRVCCGDTSAEVRKHAFGGKASAVVLPVESSCGESGFLTCAKLIRELPNARVILVGEYTEENERLALFAGAVAFLPSTVTADRLAVAIAGSVA